VHPLAAGAAPVDLLERAVWLFVEHAAQRFEPGNDQRRVHHECLDQIGIVGIAAAADHVEIVDGRAVFGAVGSLDATLSHHRVRVAKTQLGSENDAGALLLRQQCGAGARAAAADDEHVCLKRWLREIKIRRDAAAAFEHIGQFVQRLAALVRSDAQLAKGTLNVIGVKFLEHLLPFVLGHAGKFFAHAARSAGMDLFKRGLHFWCVNHNRSPLNTFAKVDITSRATIGASIHPTHIAHAAVHLPRRAPAAADRQAQAQD